MYIYIGEMLRPREILEPQIEDLFDSANGPLPPPMRS